MRCPCDSNFRGRRAPLRAGSAGARPSSRSRRRRFQIATRPGPVERHYRREARQAAAPSCSRRCRRGERAAIAATVDRVDALRRRASLSCGDVDEHDVRRVLSRVGKLRSYLLEDKRPAAQTAGVVHPTRRTDPPRDTISQAQQHRTTQLEVALLVDLHPRDRVVGRDSALLGFQEWPRAARASVRRPQEPRRTPPQRYSTRAIRRDGQPRCGLFAKPCTRKLLDAGAFFGPRQDSNYLQIGLFS